MNGAMYIDGPSSRGPQEENKNVGMTKSITKLKPSRTFVVGTEDQDSPAWTMYMEEWAKIPPVRDQFLFTVLKLSLQAKASPTCIKYISVSVFLCHHTESLYCTDMFRQCLSLCSFIEWIPMSGLSFMWMSSLEMCLNKVLMCWISFPPGFMLSYDLEQRPLFSVEAVVAILY